MITDIAGTEALTNAQQTLGYLDLHARTLIFNLDRDLYLKFDFDSGPSASDVV